MPDNIKFNLPDVSGGLDPVTNLPKKDPGIPKFNLPEISPGGLSIERPVESKYDIGTFPEQDLEQVREDEQGLGESLLYTAARIPTITAAKIGSGITSVGEFIVNTGRALHEQSLDPFYDTPLSDAYAKLEEDIKESLPLYNSQADRSKNFISRAFTDLDFWTDDILSDAVPFLASAALTGAGASKLIQPLTKSMYAARLAGATDEALQGLAAGETGAANALKSTGLASIRNNIDQLAVTGISRSVESIAEGAQTKKAVYDDLIAKGYSPEEAKTEAAKAAMLVAGMNMLLAPLDYDQYAGWFKTYSKSRDAIFKMGKEGLQYAAPSVAKTFAKQVGRNAFTEGILEEGLQSAMQNYAQKKYTGDYGEQNIDPITGVLSEYLNGFGTKEGWDAMGIGAIVGGLFGGATEAFGERQKSSRERYDNIKSLLARHDYLKDPMTSFIEEDPQTGLPKLNETKILQTIDQMGKDGLLSESMVTQLQNNYEEAYKTIDNLRFGNWAFTHFEAGQGEALMQKIDNLGELSDEEFAKMGLLNSEMKNSEGKLLTTKEIAARYKKKALEMEKLYNQVSSRFDLPDRVHLKNVFDEAVIQQETTVSLDKINEKISSLESQINQRNAAIGEAAKDMPVSQEQKELELLNNRKLDLVNTLRDSYIRLDNWTNPEKIQERYEQVAQEEKKRAEDNLARSIAKKKSDNPDYKMSKQEQTFYNNNKEKVDSFVKDVQKSTPETPEQAVDVVPKKGKLQKFGQNIELQYDGVRYENGFPIYTVKNPDGTQVEYSSQEGWFAVEETATDLSKDKEVLRGGKNHFSNLFKYRISAERTILQNVKNTLKKPDGSSYTTEELIAAYPDAFPSHKAEMVLQQVLKRPDWKNHIKLKVDKKYPKTGEPFKLKSGLYGNRPELDFVLSVTNPETGEVSEVHHTENPYFYSYESTDGKQELVDFTAITLDQFNDMFLLGYDSQAPATERDLDNLKRQWYDLKEFVDKVNAWYTENNMQGAQDIPQDWYTMGPSAALDFVKNPKASLTPLNSVESLKGAVIKSAYDMEILNNVDEPTDAPDLPSSKYEKGYFVLYQDANGYKTWVRLSPKKIVTGEQLVSRINEASTALSNISPEIPEAENLVAEILDRLNIFIASTPKNGVYPKIQFSAFKDSVNQKYFLQVESFLKTDEGIDRGKIVFESNGQPLTFNTPTELSEYLYKRKNSLSSILLTIDKSFREGIPLGFKSDDAADLFDLTTTASIIKPYTVSFKFGNDLPDHMLDGVGLKNVKPYKAKSANSAKPQDSKGLTETQALEKEIADAEAKLKDPKTTDAEKRSLSNFILNRRNKLDKLKNSGGIDINPGMMAGSAQFLKFTPETAISEYIQGLMAMGVEPKLAEGVDLETDQGIINYLQEQARTAPKQQADLANELLNKIVGYKPAAAPTATTVSDIEAKKAVPVDPVDEMLEKMKALQTSGGKIIKVKSPGEGIDHIETPPADVIADPKEAAAEEKKASKQQTQDEINQELAARKKGKGMSFDYVEQTGYTSSAQPFTLKQAAEYLKKVLPPEISLEEITELASNLGNGNVRYGYFKDGAVGLKNNAPRTIAFHEAFHAVFRAVLQNSQRQVYLNKIKSDLNLSNAELSRRISILRSTNPANYELLSDAEMADRVYEEELANRYADWQNKRGLERTAWQKLFDLIKRIADFFGVFNPVDALFRKIERGGFVKSNINPNYTESADKVVGLLSPIKSQEVVYVVAGSFFNKKSLGINVTIDDILDDFERLYDPERPENQKLLLNRPDLNMPLNIYYNAFNNTDNRTLIKEQVDLIIAQSGYNPVIVDHESIDEESEGNAGSDTERVYDKPANEYDPFEKLGSVVKRFFGTVTYETVDEFGNVVVRALDPKGIYSRLLPVLSASHTNRNQIMDKLKIMANVDPTIKVIYDALVSKTGYSEETPNGIGNGEVFLNKFKNAFQVYQFLYTQTLINPSSGEVKTLYLNKRDIGQYALQRWENEFRQYVLPRFKDFRFRDDIVAGFNKGLNAISKGKTAEGASIIYESLVRLKINVDPDFVNMSFEVPGTEGQKEMFPEVTFLNKEFVTIIRDLVASNTDLYAKKAEVGKAEGDGMLSRLKTLAASNAVFDLNVVLPTFKTPEGATAYSYSEGNLALLEKQILADKAKDLQWVESMMNSKKFRNNLFFANGSTKEARMAFAQDSLIYAEIAVTGMIKDEEKTKGVSSKNLDEHSAQMNYMALFTSDRTVRVSPKRSLTQAQYALSQIAEKNTQLAAVLPKMEYVVVPEGNIYDLTAVAKDHLFKMFIQEEQRLADQKSGEVTHLLNPKRVYFEYLEGISVPADFLENPYKYKDSILNQILNGKNDTGGIPNGEGLLKLIDQYSDSVTANMLSVGIDSKIFEEKYKKNQRAFLADLIINDFIWTNSYLQLMGLDLSVAKNFEDYVKRAALLIASGRSQNSEDSTHIIINTKESVEYIDKNTFERLEGNQKGNSNAVDIKISDAQVYSIPQSLLSDLTYLGLDETTKAAYRKLINPLREEVQEDGSVRLVEDPLTAEEKDLLDLIPKKEVIAGMNYDGQMVYQKMAVAWLTKDFTSIWDVESQSWKARPGYETLHNKREHMEKLFAEKKGNVTIHMAPLSASKLYFSQDAFESNAFNTDALVGDPRGTTSISNKYRREQVLNATKPDDKMVYSLQQHAISGSELLTKAGRELKAEQEIAYSALRDEAFNTAANLVRIQNEDGSIEKADLEIFLESLRNQILTTIPDSQLYEFLKSDGSGDFKYSPDLVHIAAKFEPLFLSVFKESFRNKVRGRKATLQSDEGLEILIALDSEGNESRIVTREEMDASEDKSVFYDKTKYSTRRLNFMSLETGKEGETYIKPAEVMMTRKTAEMMGINISDPTQADYMRVITSRIPTQNYHSIMPAVIVDFLPDYYGDTIIGPKELVLMMGADFDVDALYTYMQDLWIDNGRTIKYGQETSPEQKYRAYNYWNLKNNNILNEQIKKRVNADPKITAVKDLLNTKRQLSSISKKLQEIIAENLQVISQMEVDNNDTNYIGNLISGLSNNLAFIKAETVEAKNALANLETLNNLYQGHVKDAMNSLGMPGTFEEWRASGSPVSRGELYNRLFEANWKMFTQGSLWDAYKQFLATDSIEKAIEKVKENPMNASKGIRLGNSIPSKVAAFKSNSASKALRGIVVTANVAGLFMRENAIKLKEGITFVDEDGSIKTYSEYPTVDPDGTPEQIQEQLKKVRRISDTGSQMVGIVIDDPKDPKIWMLNWTSSTLSEIADAISLGMPRDFVFKTFALPIFSKLDRLMLLKNRAVYKQSGSKSKVLQELSGTYLKFNLSLQDILKGVNTLDESQIQRLINKATGDLTGEMIDQSLVYSPKTTLVNDQGQPLSNEAISKQFANLSYEDMAKEITYHYASLKALNLYESLSDISNYRKDTLGKIATLNRQVGSSLEDVEEMIQAIDLLDDEEASPFVNLREAIYNSQGMSTNISNIKKVRSYTELYFIKQTPFFKEFTSSINKILSPYLNLQDKENLSRLSMSALISHAISVAANNKDFANLLEPGNENSIVKRYEELSILPEFKDNPFVKWAFVKKYDPKTAKKYAAVMDTLSFDTFTKLDPNLNERIIDGHTALLYSSNPDIAKFGRDMFWYFFIKDGLMFKSESPGKFLTPESFEIVVNTLKEISNASKGDFTSKIEGIFDQSVKEIKDRYTENMFRHRAFEKYIYFVNSTSLTKFNPTGKAQVPLFNLTVDKDLVTFEFAKKSTPEAANRHLKRYNIPISILSTVGETKVNYPEYLAYQDSDFLSKTVYRQRLKLVSVENGKATYKKLTPFGDYSQSINSFYYTPAQNEAKNTVFDETPGYASGMPDMPGFDYFPSDYMESAASAQFDSRPVTDVNETVPTAGFEGNFNPETFKDSVPELPADYEKFQQVSAAELSELSAGLTKFIKPTSKKDEDFNPDDISTKCKS